jgi:hypothetical protein
MIMRTRTAMIALFASAATLVKGQYTGDGTAPPTIFVGYA